MYLRYLPFALIAALPVVCVADQPVVYNHISGARSRLDAELSEHFGKRYRVVEVPDRANTWVSPRILNSLPTSPVYREGVCVSGKSLVAAVVGVDGTVREPFAIRATNEFIGSVAVTLASEKRFAPGLLDGQTVSSLAGIYFEFGCPEDKK